MEQRLVYINHELDKELNFNLINSNLEATRCFLLIVNEFQVKNKLLSNSLTSDGEASCWYNNEFYSDEFEDYRCIEVPLNHFKNFGVIKNNRSIPDVKLVLEKMNTIYRKYFEEFYYEGDLLSIKFKKEFIFGKKYHSLLNPNSKYRDKFLTIDLLKFTQLRSKIQIFLYFKMMQFSKSGIARIKVDDIKEILDTPLSTKEFLRKIKNAVVKLEEIMQLDIEFSTVKKGREVTSLVLKNK